MNGGIIGKRNTSIKGVWTPNDVVCDTNNIAKRPVVFDTCETVAGWNSNKSGLSVSLNNSTFLHGAGAINLIKTATSYLDAYYVYRYVDLNLLGKIVGVNVFVSSGKYANFTRFSVCLMDAYSITNKKWELYHDFASGFTSGGWAKLELPVSSFTTGTGTPSPSTTRMLALGFAVSANSVTLGAGDLVVDDLYYRRA